MYCLRQIDQFIAEIEQHTFWLLSITEQQDAHASI